MRFAGMSQQGQIATKLLSAVLDFCSDSVQTTTVTVLGHIWAGILKHNWMINFAYILPYKLTLCSVVTTIKQFCGCAYLLSWQKYYYYCGHRPRGQLLDSPQCLHKPVSFESGFSSLPYDYITEIRITAECLAWVRTSALLTTLIHWFIHSISVVWEDDISA